jgi:hypothetical protein
MFFLLFLLNDKRIRIRDTDTDPDPQHWLEHDPRQPIKLVTKIKSAFYMHVAATGYYTILY